MKRQTKMDVKMKGICLCCLLSCGGREKEFRCWLQRGGGGNATGVFDSDHYPRLKAIPNTRGNNEIVRPLSNGLSPGEHRWPGLVSVVLFTQTKEHRQCHHQTAEQMHYHSDQLDFSHLFRLVLVSLTLFKSCFVFTSRHGVKYTRLWTHNRHRGKESNFVCLCFGL